jgi:ribosomal protein S21
MLRFRTDKGVRQWNRNAIPKRSVLNFKVNQKPIRVSAASFNGCHWLRLFGSSVVRAPWPLDRSTTPIEEERRVQVLVPDNSIGQALKVVQKKMQRGGIFREMKLRGHYEKAIRAKSSGEGEGRPARKLARSARVCCR